MNREIFLRMIMNRLLRFKLKSFFMCIGIVVTVVAVILVQTIGTSIKTKFVSFISDTYPANTIYLAAGNGFMGGGNGFDKLKMADVDAILQSVKGIEQWDPMVFASMNEVRSAGESALVSVIGHSDVGETARNRSVDEGVYFNAEDIQQARRVALIGKHAAEALFGSGSAVGQNVFYNNVSLEIVGVLETAGVDPHGRDLDNELHLPYTLLKDKILGRSNISGVTFVLSNERLGEIDSVGDEIAGVVRARHNLGENEKDDFTVIHSGVMMKMVDKAYRTFDIFLPVTVSVAFLVSGILILGIMAAVVKERTREIGLRKALGATQSSLRLMIVLEVLVLSALGAIVGIVISLTLLTLITPMFAEKFGIQHLSPSISAIVISVTLALISGFLGALLPANRAARMHPVTALA